MYKRLIYISKPKREFSLQEIYDLLKSARENNGTLDVTGYLVYRPDYFMQCLEGEPYAVEKIMHRVERDDRHDQICRIYDESCEHRLFSKWKMGFWGKNFFQDEVNVFEGSLDDDDLPQSSTDDERFVFTMFRTFGKIDQAA